MCAIRLIVSDLDGTLLSPDNGLTDSVIMAVSKFVKQGGLFTIATGRPFLTAAVYETELKLELPYILCNGSVIAQKGKILESRSFEIGEMALLLQEADRAMVDVLLFQEERISVFRSSEAISHFEMKENIGCFVVEKDSAAWLEEPVQKLILMGDMDVIRELWVKHSPVFGSRYAVFQSEDNYLEIIPGDQSKGAALRRLAGMLDIRPHEIMALGNQMNDLDMIRYAGIGVTVANGHKDLKAAADYVCTAGYGDGVVEAMERFCGI
ncbi:Cof-type HAD-IIB family hydrolase [Paenibacillus tarimensis]